MAHENLILFGKHARVLRKAKGLSQEALAGRIDVDRNFIEFIERGERNVGLLNLIKLAGELDVTFIELLDKTSFEG